MSDRSRYQLVRYISRLSIVCSALLAGLAVGSGPGHAAPKADDSVPLAASPASSAVAAHDAMTLDVDATDVARGLFSVRQTIAVPDSARTAGTIVLLYPEWLPGNHGPRGEIEKLAGLRFTADGKPLEWRRDAGDVYAFHVAIPADATKIVAEFQFLSATAPDQGRIVMAPAMMNLRWNNVALYPAGPAVREIPVDASVTWPTGWRAASALREKSRTGDTVRYKRTDFETLIDSPVFAGLYFKSWILSDTVTLNVVADAPEYLAAGEAQIEPHRKLVREALALFGGQPFDHYDFLLALSDDLTRIGIEHLRSSENGTPPGYFTDWNAGPGRRNLLPHEFTHSWNGKFRRPEGLATADYRTPMRDDLLWVYEGLTQFCGYVLGARSGLFSKQDTLDALAVLAAGQQQRQILPGYHKIPGGFYLSGSPPADGQRTEQIDDDKT